jgi:tRNA(Ile)-lysidine synthase
MSINNKIKDALLALPWELKHQTFVLAVSGGPDSQCLLKSIPHIVGPSRCIAVGVNHGLRPEANEELDLAENLAKSIGVPFRRVKIKVAKGPNLQARAREARYEALRTAARGLSHAVIVTAHTEDDKAENLLIGLIREGNLKTIRRLHTPVNEIPVFRPLLNVTREEIMRYLKRWSVPYATDPSNSDPKYLRVWVRNELLPMLEKKRPGFKKKLLKEQLVRQLGEL